MKNLANQQIAVLGLGHFGMSIAKVLSEHGVNLVVCDKDPHLVQEASSFVLHTLQMDITDEVALEQLGLGNFDTVIVSTGRDFEASVIAMTFAKEKGVPHIIVKAMTLRQKKILESLGADRVVLPESEMGKRVAMSLIQPDITDLFHANKNLRIYEMQPVEYWIGKSIMTSKIRNDYNVTILGIRRGKKFIVPVSPDEVIMEEDSLLVLDMSGK
ncbi:MAG: TrkA family potassium uptake protein [Oscillospiraceae bacterium]|jgi:trk system potassium uptake protein TrkA|nr:TrkA family potassium uptake protein [Oscillospiraceae bacterium]